MKCRYSGGGLRGSKDSVMEGARDGLLTLYRSARLVFVIALAVKGATVSVFYQSQVDSVTSTSYLYCIVSCSEAIHVVDSKGINPR
jgi:hypothetical protein